jgi:AcrR family transcriptional regulator
MAPRKKEDYKAMQEASRNKILMAALELFAKKGYSATSTDSIAQKAKVSKGLIYHYFKSKQDILKGIFELLMEEGNVMMEANNRLPPEQVIKNLIDYSFDFIINKTKLNRLLIGIAIQPEVVKGLN